MASGSKYASSIFSGATQGASAGAAAGPWGALGGGIVGVLGGIFNVWAEEEDEERRREILEEAAKNLGISYNEIEQTFQEFYDNYNLAKAYGFTDEEGNIDLSKLGEAGKKIQEWDRNVNQRLADAGMGTIDPTTGRFQYNDVSFNYNKDIVDDFLDPYAGNVIAASNKAVQHSAAGAGLGRSTGAAQAIAENTAREYDKLYNTALNAYNQDRTQAYNEWAKELDIRNDRFKTLLDSDKWGLGQQQQLAKDVMQFAGEEAQNLSDIKREEAQTMAKIKLGEI